MTFTACDVGPEEPAFPPCADPLYGNGTCDLQTSCGAPDIDCFMTFESQSEAQQFYTGLRASKPELADRPPLPASDPRFARMQALIDEGWEAYKDIHDVGDLASEKVPLVLIDSSQPNAFAIGDGTGNRATLMMGVHRGLIDVGASEDEVLSVVMHELEHALGLHSVTGVKASTFKFYTAPAGQEPFGFEQPDDPVVRPLLTAWINRASVSGHLTDAELSGLPGGTLAEVFVAQLMKQPASPTCTPVRDKVLELRMRVSSAINPIDSSVTLPSTIKGEIDTAMTQLQSACFSGFVPKAADVYASHFKISPAEALMKVPSAARTDVETRNFVAGMFYWSLRAREDMRAKEQELAAKKGVPWSRARWYTTEEAADDSAVATMRAMGREPASIGKILPRLDAPGVLATCGQLLAAGGDVPYGENLTDLHHATCWRAAHVKALVASGVTPSAPRVQVPAASSEIELEIEPKIYTH